MSLVNKVTFFNPLQFRWAKSTWIQKDGQCLILGHGSKKKSKFFNHRIGSQELIFFYFFDFLCQVFDPCYARVKTKHKKSRSLLKTKKRQPQMPFVSPNLSSQDINSYSSLLFRPSRREKICSAWNLGRWIKSPTIIITKCRYLGIYW